MSEVEEKTEFSFDELDEKAKERARDYWRSLDDGGWWDHTYDEACVVARILGMEIDIRSGTTANGNKWEHPAIYFSGFHTQGSGACWDGVIQTGLLSGARERMLQYAPNDTELMDLVKRAEALFEQIASVHAVNRLVDEGAEKDFPEVEIGMHLSVYGNDSSWITAIRDDRVNSDIENRADKLVSEFTDWIYGQLEAEDEWRNADEQVDEAIRANDMLFDEDGNAL